MTANKRLSVQSPGHFSNHRAESLSSNSSSLRSLSKGILTISNNSEDGESGYHPINRTLQGNSAELHGGLHHGTLSVHGLGGGGPKDLSTFGCEAPHATTKDDWADSEDGKSGCQAADKTPHGNWAGPCGGGSPGNLLTPRHGAPRSTTTEDSAESNKCKSIYQSKDGTPRGDCAEPCRGCWYAVAGRGRGGGEPGRGGAPKCAASHFTTNKDLADSDNCKSRDQSSDKTLHGNAAEHCWYGAPAWHGRGRSRPGRLSTAGCKATDHTSNEDLASSTKDDGGDNSFHSQGLEDGNDLGLSKDGMALHCSGVAALGTLAANVDQDKGDILECIWPGSHNVHLLTPFVTCHFSGHWMAYLLFACWAEAWSLMAAGVPIWLDEWLME